MTKLMPPIMTDEMIEAALPVIAKYKSVQDVYTAVYNAVPNVEQEQSARIAELEAQLAEAKRLLSDARRDVSYASDISELSAITLAHIDEFLNTKK